MRHVSPSSCNRSAWGGRRAATHRQAQRVTESRRALAAGGKTRKQRSERCSRWGRIREVRSSESRRPRTRSRMTAPTSGRLSVSPSGAGVRVRGRSVRNSRRSLLPEAGDQEHFRVTHGRRRSFGQRLGVFGRESASSQIRKRQASPSRAFIASVTPSTRSARR